MTKAVNKLALLLLTSPMVFGQAVDIFPLAKSNTWSLTNPYVTAPVTFTVTDDAVYGGTRELRMRFQTAWGSTDFLFNVVADGLDLDGINYSGVDYRFDLPSVFLRYSAVTGQTWSNPLGTVTVVTTNDVVTTPAGRFSGVLRFSIRGTDGFTQDWYIAPGIGFVQYSVGNATFLLNTKSTTPYQAAMVAISAPAACPLIGVLPNSAANVSDTAINHEKRLQQAITAGSRLLHVTYNWNDLEKSPGAYDFSELTYQTALARKYGLAVVLTIRAIDGMNLPFPSDLSGRAFNDLLVIARFQTLVSAAVSAAGKPVRWVNLGNEVDMYLSSYPLSAKPFLDLYTAGAQAAKGAKTGVSVGLIFSHDLTRSNDTAFRLVQSPLDHLAFTYYPFSNWKVKPLWVVPRDFAEMTAWAKNRPLLLTEVGAPSGTSLSSSHQYQADFYTAVYDALRTSGGKFAAANFFLMSDPSSATVATLGAYYGLQGNTLFSAYTMSLGMFDGTGAAKPAWSVFTNRSTQFNTGGCTSN
jgi:hypothetical protein